MTEPTEKFFSNGKWAIEVHAVGELVDELSRLPREMKTRMAFSGSTDIAVLNRGQDSEHVGFDHGGFWAE